MFRFAFFLPGCKGAAERFITAWDVAGEQGAAAVQFRAPLFAEQVQTSIVMCAAFAREEESEKRGKKKIEPVCYLPYFSCIPTLVSTPGLIYTYCVIVMVRKGTPFSAEV